MYIRWISYLLAASCVISNAQEADVTMNHHHHVDVVQDRQTSETENDSTGADTQHGAESTQPPQVPHISYERIASKKTELHRRADTSRWAWRSCQAATAIAVIAVMSVYWAQHNVSDHDATMSYEQMQQRIQENTQKLQEMYGNYQDTRTEQSTTNDQVRVSLIRKIWNYTTSVMTWKSLGYSVAWYLLTSARHMVASQVVGYIHMFSPAYVYRSVMRPVYISNLSHHMQHNTRYHRTLERLSMLSKTNFDYFKQCRHELLTQMIDDLEQILACISCGYDYLEDDASASQIDRVYRDLCAAIDGFITTIASDSQQVVTASISQLHKNVNFAVSEYHKAIAEQDLDQWLTTL